MGRVIDSNDTPLGSMSLVGKKSKIVEYGLEEEVVSMRMQGMKPPSIAKELNKILTERKDEIDYIRINPQNVMNYIDSYQKSLDASDPHAIKIFNNNLDIAEKLTNSIVILEDEIDKLRSASHGVTDSKQVFFIKLLKQLKEMIELAANVQGMLPQPQQVSVAIFDGITTNVHNLIRRIQESTTLTNENKQEVIDLVNNELLNENLIKTIQGEVVDVSPKT